MYGFSTACHHQFVTCCPGAAIWKDFATILLTFGISLEVFKYMQACRHADHKGALSFPAFPSASRIFCCCCKPPNMHNDVVEEQYFSFSWRRRISTDLFGFRRQGSVISNQKDVNYCHLLVDISVSSGHAKIWIWIYMDLYGYRSEKGNYFRVF